MQAVGMGNQPHNHDNRDYYNEYHAFNAVNDNRESQLSCVKQNYHVLIITTERKDRVLKN